jgi:toxin ParE1/3/4
MAYEAELFNAMRMLTRFPQLGRSRTDILPNLRSHPVGEHVIIYEADEQFVLILRILHARMDIETALTEGE